jgi:predicted signal transduction protein with EAL and GGDEF domain
MGDTEISCTFSAGVAACPFDGQTIPALLKKMDAALYTAKLNGRNQVCPRVEMNDQHALSIELSKGDWRCNR